MCISGQSLEALKYLQVELANCVDHSDPQESLEFRNLTTDLFGVASFLTPRKF
jgi:hypothetical protein